MSDDQRLLRQRDVMRKIKCALDAFLRGRLNPGLNVQVLGFRTFVGMRGKRNTVVRDNKRVAGRVRTPTLLRDLNQAGLVSLRLHEPLLSQLKAVL